MHTHLPPMTSMVNLRASWTVSGWPYRNEVGGSEGGRGRGIIAAPIPRARPTHSSSPSSGPKTRPKPSAPHPGAAGRETQAESGPSGSPRSPVPHFQEELKKKTNKNQQFLLPEEKGTHLCQFDCLVEFIQGALEVNDLWGEEELLPGLVEVPELAPAPPEGCSFLQELSRCPFPASLGAGETPRG